VGEGVLESGRSRFETHFIEGLTVNPRISLSFSEKMRNAVESVAKEPKFKIHTY
jgi:hypothetical protein